MSKQQDPIFRSIKAQRQGRNLHDFSKRSLSYSSVGRRSSLYTQIEDNSYIKNANYDGTRAPTSKAVNSLVKAIANQEKNRRASTLVARRRDQPEASPKEPSSAAVATPPMTTTPPMTPSMSDGRIARNVQQKTKLAQSKTQNLNSSASSKLMQFSDEVDKPVARNATKRLLTQSSAWSPADFGSPKSPRQEQERTLLPQKSTVSSSTPNLRAEVDSGQPKSPRQEQQRTFLPQKSILSSSSTQNPRTQVDSGQPKSPRQEEQRTFLPQKSILSSSSTPNLRTQARPEVRVESPHNTPPPSERGGYRSQPTTPSLNSSKAGLSRGLTARSVAIASEDGAGNGAGDDRTNRTNFRNMFSRKFTEMSLAAKDTPEPRPNVRSKFRPQSSINPSEGPSTPRSARGEQPFARNAAMRGMSRAFSARSVLSAPQASSSSDDAFNAVPFIDERSRSVDPDPSMRRRGAVGNALMPMMSTTPASARETRQRVSTLFGIGDRIDPRAWAQLVEKQTCGGHYEHISESFRPEDYEKRLAQQEIDEHLLTTFIDPKHLGMHGEVTPRGGRAALSNASKRKTTPQPSLVMNAAFTDRSVRLREGRAGRMILNHEQDSADDRHGQHKAGCKCPVCAPFELKPAGVPSHSAAQSKIAPVYHPKVPQSPSLTSRRMSGFQESAPTATQSRHMASVLKEDAGDTHRASDELEFQKFMKRKCKVLVQPDLPMAGSYNRAAVEETRKRNNLVDPRGGVSYILSARESDPPHPHDKITSCARAKGAFANGHSAESEKLAVHWSQNLYRFDVMAYDSPHARPLSRAVSCPPEKRSLGDPISHDFQNHSPPSSPRRARRPCKRDEGTGVREATNHFEIAAQTAEQRQKRLDADPAFSRLCAETIQHKMHIQEKAAEIKTKRDSNKSTNVKNILMWDA